jgi:hypothetical protein
VVAELLTEIKCFSLYSSSPSASRPLAYPETCSLKGYFFSTHEIAGKDVYIFPATDSGKFRGFIVRK